MEITLKISKAVLILYVFSNTAFGSIWSEPSCLADHPGFPILITNSEGISHCKVRRYIYRFNEITSLWEVETAHYLAAPTPSRVCFDKGDTLWLLNGKNYTRYDGKVWDEVELIPGYSSSGWGSRITADSSGGVWVAWNSDWGWGYTDVVYNRYKNGIWNESKKLTGNDISLVNELWSITTDAYGRVWVGWTSDYDIKAAYYENGTWSENFTVEATNSGKAEALKLEPDRNGGIWALWFCHCDSWIIKTRQWDGEAWSEPDTIADIGNLSNYSPRGEIVVDSYGAAWAVWQQASAPNDSCGDICYSVHTRSGWSESTAINTNPAIDQHPDVVENGKGRLWCVWASTRDGNDDYDFSIWGSYATSVEMKEQINHQNLYPILTVEPRVGRNFSFYFSPTHLGGHITIHDASGRLVRRLAIGENQTVYWNGTDAGGHKLPTGIYFAKYLNDRSPPLKLVLTP